MNAGAGWVGRRDVHGYCGASEESTIQRGRQCRRAGPRAQIVLYGMAAYSLSDSVECRVSSCQASGARPVDVKSQTKGPGTMRHSKPPTSTKYCLYSASTRLRSASLHTMHARSHARSHVLTYRHTHRDKHTRAHRRGWCLLFPLEAGPGERASERSIVGKRPSRMQRRGDSR